MSDRFSGRDPCNFDRSARERTYDQAEGGVDHPVAAALNSIGSTIDGSSFSGLLTCVEIGGGEKLLSIDTIHWSTRAAFAP